MLTTQLANKLADKLSNSNKVKAGEQILDGLISQANLAAYLPRRQSEGLSSPGERLRDSSHMGSREPEVQRTPPINSASLIIPNGENEIGLQFEATCLTARVILAEMVVTATVNTEVLTPRD
uniref:Uncharacterized protein n=1 Tax=Glossina austeni TaxID=7395 RepID=A0A1A9VIQ6_GLOAU